MQLIGMLDSPYVRRVAISLRMLGLAFEHRPLSVFRDFAALAAINPAVKVPTLIADDGTVLLDSTLILQHAEDLAGRSLLPAEPAARLQALHLIGFALAAGEKTVQIVYERKQRPAEKLYQPWLDRVTRQLGGAFGVLERAATDASPWLVAGGPTQADVTLAVIWRFARFIIPDVVDAAAYPALVAHSERAEALAEFIATPPEG
jgi:glutathione S-transferase